MDNYLAQIERKLEQRRDVHDQDVYLSTLLQTPSIDASVTSNGEPSIDPMDLYHQFGPAYKDTFKKIVGSTKQPKQAKQVVILKDMQTENKSQNPFNEKLENMRVHGL